MSTQMYHFQYKKENHPKLSQICSYGIFAKGLKNEFVTATATAISVRATEGLLYFFFRIYEKTFPDCTSNRLMIDYCAIKYWLVHAIDSTNIQATSS